MIQAEKLQIAVTGASGFVGRNLLNKLSESKCNKLVGVVRQSKPLMETYRYIEIADLTSTTNWSGLFAECKIDVLVHCAARVHQMEDKSVDPLSEFRRINRDGTLQLARAAAAAGVRRFIFISSVKVMGEFTLPDAPFSVQDRPNPVDPYGISKWEAEQALASLCAATGMQLVVIRPPLVYGPGVKANFRNMIKWVYRGVPLPLGAINNKRSLVALDNLIDCIETVIRHPAAVNQTFFVSDNQDVSTSTLLRGIAKALDQKALLIPVPDYIIKWAAACIGRRGIAQRLCSSLQLDISHTMQVLNWKPPVSLAQGLLKVTNDFKYSMVDKYE